MAKQPLSAVRILALAPLALCLVGAATYGANMFVQFFGPRAVHDYLFQFSEPMRLLMVFSFTCGLPLGVFMGMLVWAFVVFRREADQKRGQERG